MKNIPFGTSAALACLLAGGCQYAPQPSPQPGPRHAPVVFKAPQEDCLKSEDPNEAIAACRTETCTVKVKVHDGHRYVVPFRLDIKGRDFPVRTILWELDEGSSFKRPNHRIRVDSGASALPAASSARTSATTWQAKYVRAEGDVRYSVLFADADDKDRTCDPTINNSPADQ